MVFRLRVWLPTAVQWAAPCVWAAAVFLGGLRGAAAVGPLCALMWLYGYHYEEDDGESE